MFEFVEDGLSVADVAVASVLFAMGLSIHVGLLSVCFAWTLSLDVTVGEDTDDSHVARVVVVVDPDASADESFGCFSGCSEEDDPLRLDFFFPPLDFDFLSFSGAPDNPL